MKHCLSLYLIGFGTVPYPSFSDRKVGWLFREKPAATKSCYPVYLILNVGGTSTKFCQGIAVPLSWNLQRAHTCSTEDLSQCLVSPEGNCAWRHLFQSEKQIDHCMQP